MSSILDSLEDVRKNLEADQKRVMKLHGKLEAKLESLTNEGLKGTTEARKHIKRLKVIKDEVAKKLNTLVEAFREDYPELVGE